MKYIVLLLIILITACSTEISEPEQKDYEKIAVFETTMGTIEIGLYDTHAPLTVKNFIQYINESHYEGTVFHRVIPEFMIQAGGFSSNTTQKETRDPIVLESRNGLSNNIGWVAMARARGPHTATSQFFINTADNAFLNPDTSNDGYAVFGKVISGMDVVDAIQNVTTETRGIHENWPVEDVVITSAYIKTY